jgi:hypothetical protein
MASIWGNQLKCAHEPNGNELLKIIINKLEKSIDHQAFEIAVVAFINAQNLDVNSSGINFFILDVLLKKFPRAKYILTIRDPYSWLDSLINHSMFKPCSDNWTKLRDYRFRPDLYTHPPEERILKDNNLYTLDGYLKYWNHHNKTIIDNVPEKKLLILRTDQIQQNLDRLARFAGLKDSSKMVSNCHVFPARQKFDILSQINPVYLNRKIEEHCGALMRAYFPEINTHQELQKNQIHTSTNTL